MRAFLRPWMRTFTDASSSRSDVSSDTSGDTSGTSSSPATDIAAAATSAVNLYTGDTQHGSKHGHGVMHYANGDVYEGHWRDDQPHGQGSFVRKGGSTYQGCWQNGQTHGFGKASYADGSSYEGYFAAAQYHGQGRHRDAEGNQYEGAFMRGKPHGRGIYNYADNSSYVGMFQQSQRHGLGKHIYANGTLYEGMFAHDLYHGEGTLQEANGLRYNGIWHSGHRHNHFVVTCPNGDRYVARWQHNKMTQAGLYAYVEGHKATWRVIELLQNSNLATTYYSPWARRVQNLLDMGDWQALLDTRAQLAAPSARSGRDETLLHQNILAWQPDSSAHDALQGILQQVIPAPAASTTPSTNALFLRSLSRLLGPAQAYWLRWGATAAPAAAPLQEIWCFTPEAAYPNLLAYVTHTLPARPEYVEIILAKDSLAEEQIVFHPEFLRKPRRGFQQATETLIAGLKTCWQADQRRADSAYTLSHAVLDNMTYGACFNGRVQAIQAVLIEHNLLDADARSVLYVPNVTPEQTPTERCLAYLQAFRYRMLDSLKQADTSLTAYTDAELSAHPSFPSHFNSKTFKTYLQEQQFLPDTPADNATLDSLIAAQVALCTLDEAA